MDKTLSVKDILEAGMHLGHRTSHWDPKMKPYIFGERKGIHIIDPDKTLELLNKAYDIVKDIASNDSLIMFVGTKSQVADVIKEEALRCNSLFCTQRWLGGTLTNFVTIRKSVDKLKKLEADKAADLWTKFKKKEILDMERKMEKMHKFLDGVLDMNRLPSIIFIADPKFDKIALQEALILNIPVVAIVDTNVNPDPINYPIPANDDAVRSVTLITQILADAVLAGRAIKENSGKTKY
ncbi:MAG: 30S ribosomal protein S2 [bacterium]